MANGWPGYWGKEGPELIESTVLDGRTQKLVYAPHLHEEVPEGVGPQLRNAN